MSVIENKIVCDIFSYLVIKNIKMGNTVISNTILNILAILVLIVFIGVLYAIVYSIFMFVFSWWNEEKIKKAWNSIRYALLWFILTLIILFALPWFLRAIKVPGYRQYTSANVFKTSKQWLNRIMNVFKQTKSPIDYGNDDWNYSL